MKYDIFISYRREGGAEKAELLKAVLCQRGYKAKKIFMDTHEILSGNFMNAIDSAIEESKNMIVVITKESFKNLSEDSVWVHELHKAMDLHKNIVPVYFDNVKSVSTAEMPESLAAFPLENAVIYSHHYADATYDKICQFLRAGKRGEEPKRRPRMRISPKVAYVGGPIAAVIVVISLLFGNVPRFVTYYSKMDLAKEFTSPYSSHLSTAKAKGLAAQPEDANHLDSRLVKVSSNDRYIILTTYSINYLLPAGKEELEQIAVEFQKSLAAHNLPNYKLTVKSLLRTASDTYALQKLKSKGRISNKINNDSPYNYGLTFDISVKKFSRGISRQRMKSDDLAKVLGEVLQDECKQGHIYATYVASSSCIRITVR